MDLIEFDLLCRAASQKLGLQHTGALAGGSRISIDGVLFETTFVDGDDSFLLLADIGAIAQEDRAAVYERLLSLQLMAWDDPRVRYGFHPIHDALMLCLSVPIQETSDGTWLSDLLKAVAAQVGALRTEVLDGRASVREATGESATGRASVVLSPHP